MLNLKIFLVAGRLWWRGGQEGGPGQLILLVDVHNLPQLQLHSSPGLKGLGHQMDRDIFDMDG